MLAYPQIVTEIIINNDPAGLVQYLFDLAQDFNAYYHEVPVIKALPKVRAARLELLKAVRQVLTNGMGLAGLPVLKEM